MAPEPRQYSETLHRRSAFTALTALLVLLIAWAAPLWAQDSTAAKDSTLVVPVFPSAPKATVESVEDLANSYILMDDGSVLTVRDWIVGALAKDGAGHAMTDYDNRLFLGQVARAALDMDQTMVDRTPGAAGPLRIYTPVKLTSSQSALKTTRDILCFILCGPPEDITLARGIAGGGFNPVNMVRPAGQMTWLGDLWFAQDMMITVADFREAGIMKQMLRDAENAAQ